ncbi:MAG TPA: ribulose-phosphate 3-epimerase [Candidatus Dependentiae bacterium]|nr:ribulose-phosphate 3-epimerase [Candidatus Dependentiae bacterium]
MAIIYPTLLSLDFLNVQHEMEKIDDLASGYQLDIMDNHFVPNLTYGPDLVNAVARFTYKKLWLHLMVDDPQSFLDRFFIQPGSIVSFHIESNAKISETIKHIESKKWLPSIAINPKTPVEEIFPFLPVIHQVLVMSVDPGFAQQDFLPETIERINKLVGFRQTSQIPFRIGIDGGIKVDNIAELVNKGVDDVAVASAIFRSPEPARALQELIDRAQKVA